MTQPKVLVLDQDRAEDMWHADARLPVPSITHILSIREPWGLPWTTIPVGLLDHPAKQLRLIIRDIPISYTAEENGGRVARACSRGQVQRIVRFARSVPP